MTNRKLHMLMILDGWGEAPEGDGNAVRLARTPTLDRIRAEYPCARLACSGASVGLPAGIMGNSEVGHLNIGAGRIVYQDLLRIDRAIGDGTFFENRVLSGVMEKVRENDRTLHLMGLVSDGGVHSQLTHLFALIDMARQAGVPRTRIHAILDGRDTSPESGAGFVERLQEKIQSAGYGRIATVCGRYYAMDRDRRWERTEAAFRLYVEGEGTAGAASADAVREAYGRGETDEFVRPVVLSGGDGPGDGVVSDGDGIIFFNFRADRARQITRAFTDPGFDGFVRSRTPELGGYVCMTLYDETFPLPVAFPPVHLERILGGVVGDAGFRQLRIAETEKYAHVTYFFNGGEEAPFPGEDRCLIPSPRDVATYDQKPEMSALEVTREVIERIDSGAYDLIVLNFANMDMVGHTGSVPAAIRACETVDGCVARIVEAVLGRGGVLMVTADHGNAEKMKDDTGRPHTAHTLNRVPLILVDPARRSVSLNDGILADIAPTLLEIMGIEAPAQMTGKSLIAG